MTDEDKKDPVEAEEKAVEDKPEAEEKPVEESKAEEKADEKPAEEPEAQKSEAQEKMKKAAESAAHFAKETGKKAGESMKALWGDPLVCTHHLDGFINWARGIMPSKLYLLMARAFVKLGHVGLVLSGIAAIVCGFIAMIREGMFTLLAVGVAYAVVLLVAQYVADKFLRVGDSMVQASPSTVKSDYFLPSIALICMAGEVVVLASYLALAAFSGELGDIWLAVLILVMLFAVQMVTIHSSLVNVEVDEDGGSSGELLGILSYLVKVALRTVPVAFGLLSAFGTVFLCRAILKYGFGDIKLPGVMAPASMVAMAAILPFVIYLLAVVYRFAEGVFKSILTLGKD